jgi:hypothetical protein
MPVTGVPPVLLAKLSPLLLRVRLEPPAPPPCRMALVAPRMSRDGLVKPPPLRG